MAKNREWLTDEQVEAEIEQLKRSEYVKLARKEARLKYKRRQVLYGLRDLEKKGLALAAEGITLDNIEEVMFGVEEEEWYE